MRLAADGAFTPGEWIDLVLQYHGCCTYCGTAATLEPDHRVALSRGGSNRIDNILPACRRCNARKHRMGEAEFRDRLAAGQGQPPRYNRRSRAG
ncbi:MAG: HNH endonuclease signature motif containing protein [Candidatus Limnocylindria bacterium]